MKKLPTHLKRIIRTAKKFNLRWETISVTPDIAKQLPMWFHLGASDDIKKLNNSPSANCLRENHDVRSVGETEIIATRQGIDHREHRECPCAQCAQDRSRRCRNPPKCIKSAKELMSSILPKWNPITCSPHYTLHISPDQIPASEEANDNNVPLVFNPVFPSPESIEEGFRVFVTQSPPSSSAASQSPAPQGPIPDLAKVTIAEAYQISKDGDHISGGVAWFGDNDPRNILVKLPDNL
ncbi:hypothetical protein P692DRAFT_201721023, partial [Suillus brevipes Sb2]